MNLMAKLMLGIGSLGGSARNGIEDISLSSVKSGAKSVKDTASKYGSLIAQGYSAARASKQAELPLKEKS